MLIYEVSRDLFKYIMKRIWNKTKQKELGNFPQRKYRKKLA